MDQRRAGQRPELTPVSCRHYNAEQDPGHRAEVFKSLANRLNMMRANGHPNLTLRQYLNSKPNFYGPIRRGEINENYLRREVDPYRGPKGIDAEIDEVLGGSNRVRGMTDQGSRGDPNFGVGETIMSHGEGYNDFGGRGGQGPAARYGQNNRGVLLVKAHRHPPRYMLAP